jgi:hypothetical protein
MDELPDINAGISKPDLFEKFKAQLQKDFEFCNLDGTFAIDIIPDFDRILKVVHSEVEKINRVSSGKINELLYRIDISEAQIKKAINSAPDSELTKIISELIVKRELQKIIIKEHFKNK